MPLLESSISSYLDRSFHVFLIRTTENCYMGKDLFMILLFISLDIMVPCYILLSLKCLYTADNLDQLLTFPKKTKSHMKNDCVHYSSISCDDRNAYSLDSESKLSIWILRSGLSILTMRPMLAKR